MELKAYDKNDDIINVVALYMDGYDFGDRLLEGVPFKITIKDDKLKAECLDKYSKGINWAYWEQVCVKHALEADVFSTTRALDNDDGFIE